MNPKKTMNSTLFLTLAAIATAHGATVSWNLDRFGTVSGTNVAGVVPVANWNNSFPSNPTVNLIDSTGAATTLDISYSSFNTYSVQGSTPAQDLDGTYNRRLLNGYLNSGTGQIPAVASITIAEIPYTQYDLIVYFSSDVADRTGTVTNGPTTYSFNTLGPASVSAASALLSQTTDTTLSYATDANYAVFSNLSGTSQTLTTSIPSFGGIAGFQIVAVPEPSVPLLGGVAVFGLLRRRRRA